MAANDMTDALKNPHMDVPFTQVGDDTISALTALAEISNPNYKKYKLPPFQLRLPRLLYAHASPNHPIQC
jgi:hypothetical protein